VLSLVNNRIAIIGIVSNLLSIFQAFSIRTPVLLWHNVIISSDSQLI
jgi:hypothetical protein